MRARAVFLVSQSLRAGVCEKCTQVVYSYMCSRVRLGVYACSCVYKDTVWATDAYVHVCERVRACVCTHSREGIPCVLLHGFHSERMCKLSFYY